MTIKSTPVINLLGLLETCLDTFEIVKVSQEVVDEEKVVTLTVQVVRAFNYGEGRSRLVISLMDMLQAGLDIHMRLRREGVCIFSQRDFM